MKRIWTTLHITRNALDSMRIGQQRTRLLCLVWFSLHFGHRIFIFFLRSLNIFDFYLFFRFSLIKFICVDVVYVRVVASTESHSVRARQRTFMESRTNKFSFRIVRFAFRHVLQVFFFFWSSSYSSLMWLATELKKGDRLRDAGNDSFKCV